MGIYCAGESLCLGQGVSFEDEHSQKVYLATASNITLAEGWDTSVPSGAIKLYHASCTNNKALLYGFTSTAQGLPSTTARDLTEAECDKFILTENQIGTPKNYSLLPASSLVPANPALFGRGVLRVTYYVGGTGSNAGGLTKETAFTDPQSAVDAIGSLTEKTGDIRLLSDVSRNRDTKNFMNVDVDGINITMFSYPTSNNFKFHAQGTDGGDHRVMNIGNSGNACTVTAHHITFYGGRTTDKSDGAGIYVDKSCTLNLYSGASVMGNTADWKNLASVSNGGGIIVNDSGAALNMYDGAVITQNVCTGGDGGGVYVGSSGTFNMFGGSIIQNTGSTGMNDKAGGIYIQSGGTLIMHGGTVSGNTAKKGDQIYNEGTAVYGDGSSIGSNAIDSTVTGHD